MQTTCRPCAQHAFIIDRTFLSIHVISGHIRHALCLYTKHHTRRLVRGTPEYIASLQSINEEEASRNEQSMKNLQSRDSARAIASSSLAPEMHGMRSQDSAQLPLLAAHYGASTLMDDLLILARTHTQC